MVIQKKRVTFYFMYLIDEDYRADAQAQPT